MGMSRAEVKILRVEKERLEELYVEMAANSKR